MLYRGLSGMISGNCNFSESCSTGVLRLERPHIEQLNCAYLAPINPPRMVFNSSSVYFPLNPAAMSCNS